MKSYKFYSVFVLFMMLFIALISCREEKLRKEQLDITAQEIWDKTITYHDPLGKWDSFGGEMHMVTVIGKNNVVEEIIEINKPENFYKCTWINGDDKLIKGMKDNSYFYSINENQAPSDELLKAYGFTDDNTALYKEHHTSHFGLPMELKSSGMTLDDHVELIEYDGRECYALTFIGLPENVKHSYYEGKWILYVDAVNFAMRGIQLEELAEYPPSYAILSGEIIINGVKIPHTKAAFKSEDNSHSWTSIYTPLN